MASAKGNKGHEVSQTPLADFFWIAGLDGQDLFDAYYKAPENRHSANGTINYGIESTIEEDKVADYETTSILESPRPTSRHAKHDSFHRLSRLSDEARHSIRSIDLRHSDTDSKRSSATIRAAPSPGPHLPTALSDVDFDNALTKFSTDRESFFLDLNFSAGAVTRPPQSKQRSKTQKIVPEEINRAPSRGLGSIRRHMSFRERSGMKRQPSVIRRVSTRTSRRASNYNSVIPVPEALNTDPNLHPLKRKFEPVLLDRYPQKDLPDESKRRGKFPDYVPMFAFPNDINVVSSDTRPRSTWHGFSMTASDNSRVYAICIIVWVPMSQTTAIELEMRCEEWRRENMGDAERELATSLGERLAAERAKLSRLLAGLPHVPSGSSARDELEDEISSTEEKINVMADMLRPLRHGASSKIEGLTESETGIWVPRAYGLLGRDGSMTSFWKEWLRAVVVPMSDNTVLRVPPSSPKVGMWQPLERYVVNLCTEAPSPISSKVQVEIGIRELRLFARKSAENELPGSRNADLYPLFRALTLPNIMVLMEYVLAESRIIILSAHTSMLQLVSRALVDLIWPLQWTGILIPVLPARLIQALEAPCPYICGIERRYDQVVLPDDDYVLVDLDNNEIQSTSPPTYMPKQQRRKLMSLLQLAAPHHYRCGVPTGPPAYAVESFPFDGFSSENASIFNSNTPSTHLARLVSLTSTGFGAQAASEAPRGGAVYNAFNQASSTRARSADRPTTSSTTRTSNPRASQDSPTTANFPPLPNSSPMVRNDSGYALQASLREKRSGHFDSFSKRSGSVSRRVTRRPSLPLAGHYTSNSVATINITSDSFASTSTYAPSSYAQSTIAASTIMPGMLMQPVRNTESTCWVEGHCLNWRQKDGRCNCTICDERAEDGHYRCTGCGITVHGRCGPQISVVCSTAFHPDQIRAAFVRCFASIFYTYRKFMRAPDAAQKKNGMKYKFAMDDYIRSLPTEMADYTAFLRQTQSFNEFFSEREMGIPTPSQSVQSSIALFDSIILAKRNRGRTMNIPGMKLAKKNPFASRTASAASQLSADFLSDTAEHLWRTAAAPSSSTSERPQFGEGAQGRDYREIVTRAPAKLEEGLMREPRMIHGVPRITERMRHPSNFSRKVIPIPREAQAQAPAQGLGIGQERSGATTTRNGTGNLKKTDGERDMSRATLKERLNGLNMHAP